MKKTLLIALLAAALPMSAMASEKSYTFVDGGYVNVDGDADGAYVRGNYQFGQSGVYLTGQFARVEVDNTSFDVNNYELGLGYRYTLSDRFDLIGEATRARIDTDFGDANGYRASVGTRFDITSNFEGLAQINHYNGLDFAADNTATVSGLYKFGPVWGVNGGIEFDNDDNQIYTLGVSASF
jgi:opacity protein-like surface antigen